MFSNKFKTLDLSIKFKYNNQVYPTDSESIHIWIPFQKYKSDMEKKNKPWDRKLRRCLPPAPQQPPGANKPIQK